MEEHFEGAWGLRKELIDAGITDAETGHITDPRRVLIRDEMPQFVNYASNKGNTKEEKAAGAGDECHGVESEN